MKMAIGRKIRSLWIFRINDIRSRKNYGKFFKNEASGSSPWLETDVENLYKYAKDPDIGLPAGWPPHKNVEESLEIIKTVLKGKESYAICEKNSDEVIGECGFHTVVWR